MKRSLISLSLMATVMLFLQQVHAQQKQIWMQDFDGTLPPPSWSVSPAGAWESNTFYHLPGSSVTNPQSYWGLVPTQSGSTTILATEPYDCTPYQYVFLRFRHICKVSPSDSVRIEYRTGGILGTWKTLPFSSYEGSAINYALRLGFSAASYPEWQAKDSLAMPTQLWWKEELFNLTGLANLAQVEFRFIIQRSSVQGTQVSYGWLLENIEVIAANHEIYPPTVEFVAPLVKDTFYTASSQVINARVQTNTTAPIKTPWLKYTATNATQVNTDSVLMTSISGNSLWVASIPQFPTGTTVNYSITGIDTNGNQTTISSQYAISAIHPGARGLLYFAAPDTAGTLQSANTVYVSNAANVTWSRTLYLNSELTGSKFDYEPVTTVIIDRMAWYTRTTTLPTRTQSPVIIYLQPTNAATMNVTTTGGTAPYIGYVDPRTQPDAVMVYRGSHIPKTGWNEVLFSTPVTIPAGSNLMVYILDSTTVASGTAVNWAGRTSSQRTVARLNASTGVQTQSPIMRFGVKILAPPQSSVALIEFAAPAQYYVHANQMQALKVILQNRGSKDLDSCIFNWTLNGEAKPPYKYTGNLAWSLSDTVEIGSFMPSTLMNDEIVVWVSMPNGEQDPAILDDTLKTSLMAGTGPLSGDYIIGQGQSFTTVPKAIHYLNFWGASGDIRFLLPSGIHNTAETWDFTGTSNVMNSYTLTLTSQANHRDSTTIVRTTTATGQVQEHLAILGNTDNLIFEAITLERTAAGNVIQFTDKCTNILINNCRLTGHPTMAASGQSYTINRANRSNYSYILDNIRITNNIITGGESNIYLMGNASATAVNINKNIIIDNNVFGGGGTISVQLAYSHIISASHNRMNTRTNTYYSMTYLDFNYCRIEKIIGNSINVSYSGANNYPSYGNVINLRSLNQYRISTGDTLLDLKPTVPTLIANNEIFGTWGNPSSVGNAASAGISISYAAADTFSTLGLTRIPVYILHNSLYLTSTLLPTADIRGIFFGSVLMPANQLHVVQRNLIHIPTSSARPVFFTAGLTFNANRFDINSNNYSANSIGQYNGTDVTSLDDWKDLVTTDIMSRTLLPDYIDNSQGLKLNDYMNFMDTRDSRILDDIEGTMRGPATSWGAYTNITAQIDATMHAIHGLKPAGEAAMGGKDSVRVEIFNAGIDTITAINVCWSINGTNQAGFPWTGSLPSGESLLLTLGEITYGLGNNAVEIYSCGLGSLTDDNPSNDTIRTNSYVCQAQLSGTYTIGGTAGPRNFATFSDFTNAVDTCGVGGNIILEFTGKCNGSVDLLPYAIKWNNNIHLTITGATGNDTIHAAGTAISIGSNRNITIKDITIKSDMGFCVFVSGPAKNLTVRNCNLLANPAGTGDIYNTRTSGGINKPENTGMWDSIFIVGNRIDGGNLSAYLGGGATASNRDYIIFDSNECINSYSAGVYTSSTYARITYNQITHRIGIGSWVGIRASSNGDIMGNRIEVQATPPASANSRIIELSVCGRWSSMLVANNEIFLNSSNIYGIYFSDGGSPANGYAVNIVHNSIWGGTSAGIYGFAIYTAQTNIAIMNNDIYTIGSSSTPISITDFYPANLRIGSNNYYAPNNRIGICNGTLYTSLGTWKNVVTSDTNSENIRPVYAGANSLRWQQYQDLLCTSFPGVTVDKENSPRGTITTKGCYTPVAYMMDLANLGLVNFPTEGILGQKIPVNVEIMAASTTPIQNATFAWSVNGGTPQTKTITFSPALSNFDIEEITIDTFNLQYATSDLMVWIDQVNGQKDDNLSNDTVRTATLNGIPLAEFAAPLIADTIYQSSCNVRVRIFGGTGAPTTAPEMYVHAIHDSQDSYDTIPMTGSGDIWAALIAMPYYNTKVIYSIQVSDMTGNTAILIDSTFLALRPGEVEFDLTALDIISPVNRAEDLCVSGYTALQIAVQNIGVNNYNFTDDIITIGAQVIDPHGSRTHYSKTINSGILLSGGIDTMEIAPSTSVLYAGNYDIRVYVSNSRDTLLSNDTLAYTYNSGRIGFPVDEIFSSSNLPNQFVSNPDLGTTTWMPYLPDVNNAVQPDFGTGMLLYEGPQGSMATLSTRQLDMYGAINPILEFWYYHDTTTSSMDDSYTDVVVIADGVPTNELPSILKRDRSHGHGWAKYVVNLSNYTTAECVLITFQSMNRDRNGGSSVQYIDRIHIAAEQDLEIAAVFISPEIELCNSTANRKVYAVVRTTMTQAIDFSQYPTDLALEITGKPTLYYSLTGSIAGHATDTILIDSSINFTTGTHILKAYLTTSIDGNSLNDTAKTTIEINPQFAIGIEKLSDSDLAKAGFEHSQKVTIKNTGNMELSDIGLILTITSDEGDYTFNASDTFNLNLQPNDSTDFTFDSAYIVPWSRNYDVKVHGYLMCDSILFNANFYAQEEVDINDLYIVDITSPQNNTVDTVNSLVEVSVTVKNKNLGTSPYNNVEISLLLTDTNGNPIADPVSEYIPSVAGGMEYPFTFSERYRVPEVTKYHLSIFIEQKDNYTGNDTMAMVRETTSDVHIVERAGVSFTMEQNIPNPAKANTIINYHIPQDGEIIFQIHSVSGQILYNKVENVPLGEHQIELNLSDYASGIYFYSMEYKGHRIVKRMNVK